MYNLGYPLDWDGAYYKFAVLMAFGNCTINPFIYLIKYQDYQRALRSCFRCKEQREKDDSELKSRSTLSTIGSDP